MDTLQTFDEDSAEPPDSAEFLYYKWLGPDSDRVPAYSSANGGAGVLILSHDKSKLLLVHEYGWWKPVTGIISPGESKVQGVIREAMEEVGIRLSQSNLTFVGGWQAGGQWDGCVNDEFAMVWPFFKNSSSASHQQGRKL